jgi:hypothetical protein
MSGYLTAILPSIGVLLVFWLAIRAMFQADRRERLAQARFEAEQDARAAVVAPEPPPSPDNGGPAAP